MKDIILIAGQNAVGKTAASSYFMQIARERGIAYEPEPIDDFSYLFNQILKDDLTGGRCHYHDWSGERSKGHSHANGGTYIPFVVTHTALSDGMHNEFFSDIALLPKTGKLWFVEWTGGWNTNLPDNLAAQTDFSFTRACKMIKEGRWPVHWLERIYAIIHISADIETRFLLNTKDSEYPSFKESSGQILVRRVTTVLEIFGQDDFSRIKPLFRDYVDDRLIFDVYNKGDKQFYYELAAISNSLFNDFCKTDPLDEKVSHLV